jgi:hypothetical protein
MKFEEINLIIEGVSKSQKEAGQIAMAVKNATIKSQLTAWFNDRWSAKNAYKNHLNLKNKLKEKERLDRIINQIDKNVRDSKFHINKMPDEWSVRPIFEPGTGGAVSQPTIFRNRIPEKNLKLYLNPKAGSKELVTQNYLHETKHLLDFFKEIIITGKIKSKKYDTIKYIKKGKLEEVKNIEGEAEAHGLDNMYRKDRRNLLASKYSSHFTKSPKSKSDLKTLSKISNTLDKNELASDLYKRGAQEHSKTLKPTLQSLKNEYKNIVASIIKKYIKTSEIEIRKLYKFVKKEKLDFIYSYLKKALVKYTPSKDASLKYTIQSNSFLFGDYFEDDYFNRKERAVDNIKEAAKREICRNIDWALRNWEFN